VKASHAALRIRSRVRCERCWGARSSDTTGQQ
jgi:hypothetical protein